MKTLSRVVWSEGMHLGPQHFQVQNRYFENLVHFTSASLNYEPWGLAGVQVDVDALRNGMFSLVHARGILPDGLVFLMPESDTAPEPRAIADLFPPMQEYLDMHLAISPVDDKGPNCAQEGRAADGLRYAPLPVDLPDELTGGDFKTIRLAKKNLRLMAEAELTGELSIPVARIRRDSAGQFALDRDFIPPVVRIQASERVMLILRRMVDMLDEKSRQIVRPKDMASGTASGFSAEGISNSWFLHCVNASLTPLRHLLAGQSAHPEELYTEMSRLGGALCTFGLSSHPSTLPKYDHRKLTECFADLDLHIRKHLELVVPSNCVRIQLSKARDYFYEGNVTDPRTLQRARWILGIRSKVGEAELIAGTPRLAKICSKEFLPKLVSRALPGMTLTHIPTPPSAISPRVDSQYFSVDRAGPCWDHIVQTREVAVYIPGELPEPDVELMVVVEG